MPPLGKLGVLLGAAAVALALLGAALSFDAAARPEKPDPPPQKTDNSGLKLRGLGL